MGANCSDVGVDPTIIHFEHCWNDAESRIVQCGYDYPAGGLLYIDEVHI